MKIEFVHIVKLGQTELDILTVFVKNSDSSSIERRLIQIEQGIKSLKEIIMKSQAQIDKLTEDVKSNTANLSAELSKEAEEIKAAMDSSKIDTTKLEAAISESKALTDKVKDLFIPESSEQSELPGPGEPSEPGESLIGDEDENEVGTIEDDDEEDEEDEEDEDE